MAQSEEAPRELIREALTRAGSTGSIKGAASAEAADEGSAAGGPAGHPGHEQARKLKAQLKKLDAAERKVHAAYLKERTRLAEALGGSGGHVGG